MKTKKTAKQPAGKKSGVAKEYLNFLGNRIAGQVKGNRFLGDNKRTYPMNVKGVTLITEEEFKEAKVRHKQLMVERQEQVKKTPKGKPVIKTPIARKAGVIGCIVETLMEDYRSKQQILDVLKVKFTDRPEEAMKRTIQAQLSGGKQTRLEKEKGIKLETKFVEDMKYFKVVLV